jgi:hypothetical protein
MGKKLRLLTAAAILCAVFALTPGTRAEETTAEGDPSGDYEIRAASAAAVLRGVALGLLDAAGNPEFDLTKNGVLDETDARAMLLLAVGGISDPEAFGERVSSGLCDESLFDRFSYTGVKEDGKGNYKSDTVSVVITRGRTETSDYQLADICVQDLSCLKTVFSDGKYNGGPVTVKEMFETEPDAIVGINGDYYKQNHYGPVIRNGEIHLDRITRKWDIAVLLYSGELVTYDYSTLTKEMMDTLNIYQTWVFGPSLLDAESSAKTKFRSAVQDENPRSVLGYFEPGHYAFLTVDGRSKDSKGLTMRQLSELCETLGFLRAYNLDGGQSSVLIAKDGPVNSPYRNGRPISDSIVICDPRQEAADAQTDQN